MNGSAALREQPAAQVLAQFAPPQAALVRRWLETQGYPFSRA